MSPVLNPSENGYNSRAKGRSELSTISDDTAGEFLISVGPHIVSQPDHQRIAWDAVLFGSVAIGSRLRERSIPMSLDPQVLYLIPEETARVARAAFPHGTLPMRMRDVLGPLYQNQTFAQLFPARGQPAIAPARLAMILVMQMGEGLSDREAADAVRGRIDWKYALALELTDPGFDASVLSEFRARLIAADPDQLLLVSILTLLTEPGLLKAGGRQRTDSTCATSRGIGIPPARRKNTKGGSWVTQST
jgi:transposase